MVADSAEVIVVGLGAMGSAISMQLAARAVPVIGIDQYRPPHEFGSTHGETRITRLAIGEGSEYVPLVRRSHELWRQIERDTGEQLLVHTGGLIMAPSDSPFLAQTRAAANQYAIEHENLGESELAERFPMFKVAPGTEAYYEPEAGYVRPEAAVRAQLQLAARHGARLHFNERVSRWSANADGVTVDTDQGSYRASRLVLSAGPWLPELFPEGAGTFAVHRQVMYWFPIRERPEHLDAMPIFVFDHGGALDGFVHLDGFYGFPPIEGRVKVATESYDRTAVPDGRQHPATVEETAAMYRTCVAPHLPWLGPEPLHSVSCLYTNTRGSRFVIDRHPGHERVEIVSPCSGHGFKHSAAIGEAVAQRVIDGASELDLTPFALT
jgi:sarcosine oxidase